MTLSQTTRLSQLTRQVPEWSHPDVEYWHADWETIRHAKMGEKEVKAHATTYLPKFSGMDDADYNTFLTRATFFNMTARTVSALVGTIFRRNPVLTNIPAKLKNSVAKITKANQSLTIFSKTVADEIISMGRYGVLIDMDTKGANAPYLTGYLAENILDWNTMEVDGREVVCRIVLRESIEHRADETSRVEYFESYRVLTLHEMDEMDHSVLTEVHNGILQPIGGLQYTQTLYVNSEGDADLANSSHIVAGYPVIPTRNGVPLDFIPFVFFGALSLEPDIQKSPIMDIVRLNMSHYRSYADLEHGRFYTGFPVYYASATNNEDTEYTLGPNRVWLVEGDSKPGILEFNGQGLKHLENALEIKEQQVASLGGRLMGVQGQATSESDNQLKMKERNEQALLLNVSTVLDEGFTILLQWLAWWQNVGAGAIEDIDIEFNKDFLLDNIGARELRAIHSMYMDGIIPIDVLYSYLRKSQVVPDYMTLEEFKELLDSMEQFPNQPDAEARKAGFPDKKAQLADEQAKAARQDAEKVRKDTEKLAKQTAKASKEQMSQTGLFT